MKFYDLNHAYERLTGSIIRLGKLPILISSVAYGARKNTLQLKYSIVGGNNDHYTYFPNNDINLKPVPLGLLINNGEVLSTSRMPARMWKIGLTPRNLYLEPMPYRPLTFMPVHVFNTQAMADTIMGVYPTYTRARKTSDNGDWSAFGRDFATGPGGLLCHRFCGIVGSATEKPTLHNNYQYLRELLSLQYGGEI